MDNEDVTMESTTDTEEQIAEGLAPDTDLEGVEAAASDEATPAADATVVDPPVVDDPSKPAPTETKLAARGTADRKARPQRKSVDGAAAAARRKAEAEAATLKTENERLARELEAAKAAKPAPAPPPVETPAADAAPAIDIPDTHPEVAKALKAITDLGPRPKQEDFADYNEFEEKKDEWIETRASLRTRADIVREDVARREAARVAAANRAEAEADAAFLASMTDAKTRHADYDTVMDAARTSGLEVQHHIGQAVRRSPIGAEVSYYLATHREEVTRLNGLDPHRAVAEVGKLEARLEAEITAGKKPAATPGRVTKAPDPQRNLMGDLPTHTQTKDLNDPNLTQAEYNAIRNAQDRERGRPVRGGSVH